MDIQIANELVAMRHEELARSRHARSARAQSSRRAAIGNARKRLAMWAFGPGVMAPRIPRPGARVAAVGHHGAH